MHRTAFCCELPEAAKKDLDHADAALQLDCMQYDFSTLSHSDFEDLVRDLLGRELDVRFEAFTEGRDDAIDGRHALAEGAIILQAKHYRRSTFSMLKSKMKRERRSIDALQAKRYILATSKPLTPPNKSTLAEIIGPSLRADADIFGPDDLNALLRKYPDIETSHLKLWGPSTPVLKAVLAEALMEARVDNAGGHRGDDLILFEFWKTQIDLNSLAWHMHDRPNHEFNIVISDDFISRCIYFLDQIDEFLAVRSPSNPMRWAMEQFIRAVRDFIELIGEADPRTGQSKYLPLFLREQEHGNFLYLVDTERGTPWGLPASDQIGFEKHVLRQVMFAMIVTANGVIHAENGLRNSGEPHPYIPLGPEMPFIPNRDQAYPGLEEIRQKLLEQYKSE